MKRRIFFYKNDVILSTITSFIVGGLVYQGFCGLWNQKSYTIFTSERSHKK